MRKHLVAALLLLPLLGCAAKEEAPATVSALPTATPVFVSQAPMSPVEVASATQTAAPTPTALPVGFVPTVKATPVPTHKPMTVTPVRLVDAFATQVNQADSEEKIREIQGTALSMEAAFRADSQDQSERGLRYSGIKTDLMAGAMRHIWQAADAKRIALKNFTIQHDGYLQKCKIELMTARENARYTGGTVTIFSDFSAKLN